MDANTPSYAITMSTLLPPSAMLEPRPTDLPPHARTAQDVLSIVDSTDQGLSTAEAKARLEKFGPNVLPRAKSDGPLVLLWRQINNPLIWVLIASGFVAMIVDWHGDGLKNGLVILGVVALNTLIGFIQEFKAGKAIEALSQMVPENVTALRDGQKTTLPAADLVPGDVVMLASGDKVPADMRLLAVRSLQIEEAALTGESVPTEKSLAPVDPKAGPGDRKNMTFGGTLVTYGTGTAVVTSTAEKTELGRISKMLKEATDLQTPLTKALAQIGKYITVAIIVIALAMIVLGTLRSVYVGGMEWMTAIREQLIFAIALAVGAIPEGLPAIVTIALAIGVQRMAARRAVIRKLPAVETLGSTTTICSDKTGTLTRNEMTVQALWTPVHGHATVTGVGYAPKGDFSRKDDDIRDLLRAGAICNDSTVAFQDNNYKVTGDPTEAALVASAEKFGIDPNQIRARDKRIDAIPFESENQFMATLNNTDGGPTIFLKGAPEVVLKRCNIDPAAALHVVEELAKEGMRVLGFAAKRVDASQTSLEMDHVKDGFDFVGLQGMIDPPRQEAMDAVKACHGAGITVKMITGDHKATAAAIGRQLGLITTQAAVTGAQLAETSDEDLKQVVNSTNVFARVAPEHKLRLVKALQAQNQVVAMTGDGVNDAPALKQSNIGVAMGITGTAVSKEAADIVLTDDNFASIAAAVEEGRRVYDNLIKSLAFVLPTNLGLAMILMAAVAFFPFMDVSSTVNGVTTTIKELLVPMLPTQLLWINLVATVALALPLAFEAKEPDVMRRKPREPDAPVLNGFVIFRTFLAATLMAAGAIGLFLYEYHGTKATVGEVLAQSKAQTMAVTTVIFFQIFYMLNCRSLKDSLLKIGLFSNKAVFIGIVSLLILQALFIYAPFMQTNFSTSALQPFDIVLSILVGAVILPVISIEKFIRNRKTA
jgi:calcium-translocating P-type ATPase